MRNQQNRPMAASANIQSIETLTHIKAKLCVLEGRAKPALDQAMREARRTVLWLRDSRLLYWKRQVALRTSQVADARKQLLSAEMSGLNRSPDNERKNLAMAKRRLEEAERKVAAVKRWVRQFEAKAQPHVARCRRLAGVLDHEVPLGIVQLDKMIAALAAYAEPSRPSVESSDSAAADGDDAPSGE